MAKKNTHRFLNEISNYDEIRRILQHVYMYACYSPNDMFENGLVNISNRTISDHLKRLENYINKVNDFDYLTTHNLPGRKTDKKSRNILKDPFKYSSQVLANTYRFHNITDTDLIFYIYTLFLFTHSNDDETLYDLDFTSDKYTKILNKLNNEKPKSDDFFINSYIDSVSTEELYNDICELYSLNEKILSKINNKKTKNIPKRPFNLETCRSKLNDLVDLGILKKEKALQTEYDSTNIPKYQYSLVYDIFDKIHSSSTNIEIINELIVAASFYSSICALSVPGYFFIEKCNILAELYNFESNELDKKFSTYFHSGKSSHTVIDNDIMWFLAKCIDKKQIVTFEYGNYKQEQNTNPIVFPIKIITDKTYGRIYLFGLQYIANHGYKSSHLKLWRVDKIYKINLSNSIPDDKKYIFHSKDNSVPTAADLSMCYSKYMENVWNVSHKEDKKHIVLNFEFANSKREQKLCKYLKISALKGQLIECGINKYTYTIDISDPNEMTPWINSFGHTVTIDSKSDSAFIQHLSNNKKEWLNIYESIQ